MILIVPAIADEPNSADPPPRITSTRSIIFAGICSSPYTPDKALGYKTISKEVTLKKGKTLEINVELEEDQIALDGVVVSANRAETSRRLAPTLVNVLDAKVFTTTNAVNLAQGLNFQPGVRVETNCQNCGFQQVRINGLDGPYTQILIDSRPIFSA